MDFTKIKMVPLDDSYLSWLGISHIPESDRDKVITKDGDSYLFLPNQQGQITLKTNKDADAHLLPVITKFKKRFQET